MREFAASVNEALRQGLRPEPEAVARNQFLQECYNVKPTQFGLKAHEPAIDPFQGGVTTSFPLPRLFFLESDTILVKSGSISEVDKTTTPWSLSQYSLQALDGVETQTSPTYPHVADLKESWYLFDGGSTFFHGGWHRFTGRAPEYWSAGTVTINTGTDYKGRIVGGGFDPADFWSSRSNEWDNIISSWRGDEPADVNYKIDNVGRNWIAWSSIGGGDFPLWWMYPEPIRFESFAEPLTEELLLQRMKRAELGWMPMPFDGWVLKIAQLGDNLVVYGEDGIAVVQPFGVNMQAAPDVINSTFGAQKIADVGIADRGAVAMGRGRHVFVGADSGLWVLDSNEGLQRLGYEEYMSLLIGTDITSHYDPFEEEFHFCSENDAFVLTGSGLAEHKDHYTGSGGWAGKFYALSHSPNTTDVEVRTSPVSFQLQARKRLQSVQVHHEGLEDLEVTAHTRYDRDDIFREVDTALVNKEGVAHIRAVGVDFEVELEASIIGTAEVKKVDLRYQVPDKRGIRGAFQDAG